ncbi:cobalamin B12-binding domain-containing protein [bacterium]|nr:cobalamin B12-binding domain-containing protein [FCB group bacterium]MBL7190271.1 cobalamin B12-binding domain-containing protein [bacterium]
MNNKKIKILLAKPGLDGHDVGVKVLGHALVDAGFEIVYTGLRKTIVEIVKMAEEKQAGLIGLSILSGTHLELCKQMAEEMRNRGLTIPWIAGGNIPDKDVEAIKSIGALAAFPTGTTIEEVIEFCNKQAEKQKFGDIIPPSPL